MALLVEAPATGADAIIHLHDRIFWGDPPLEILIQHG
jgi:hypothetical protein